MKQAQSSVSVAVIEAPGIVVSVPEGSDLRVGASVEEAFGVAWSTLLELSPIAAPIATKRGLLRAERLTSKGGLQLLLVAEPRLTHSTVPPPSSTRGGTLTLVRGEDPSARAAVDLALRLAKTALPIYVGGEEGAGADVLTSVLLEELADKTPRLELQLGTLSPAALEASLFGVGADQVALLCLHDLHKLDEPTGQRLARELEAGRYRDAQLVADGLPDLRARALTGGFSKELATILRSSSVELPPLRDREDFDFLVGAALRALTGSPERAGRGRARDIKIEVEPEAMRALRSHSWPLNLRELSLWLSRALAAAAPSERLTLAHFPAIEPSAATPAREGLRRSAERAALEEALRASAGNVSAAAKRLGVARSTLYRLLERHGLPH